MFNYESDKHTIGDFLYEHDAIGVFLFFAVPIIILVVIAILGLFICHNLEIAELNEKARICTETGYGCTSNTINKDIRYDNTPIVEVNNESAE